MGINKVIYGGRTLIDISDSTLTADDLLEGLIAYNKAGERIVGQMAQIVIDTQMSDTSTNAVQNKVIKAYIDANSGGSQAMASMFNIAMADEYFVTDESEAPTIISNALNLDGFVTPIGTSGISWKKPTVTIPSIDWSTTVDDNYDIVGTGSVQVHFGNAGSISKTVTFKKPGEGKLYAVKGSNANVAIDTGIAADYGYTLHAKGFGDTSTTVLIGAFVSNTARTTFRILPSSGAGQQMWPNNTQYSSAQLGGITVTSLFEYWQKANSLRVVQGNIDNTIIPTGNTASGSVGANLFLLNEDASSSRGYGTLLFAEVLNGNTQVAYFAPYKLHSEEVVIINTSGLTAQQIYDIVEAGDSSAYASRILRPTRGTLIEVTQ